MSEIGEIIADVDNNNIMESSDAPAEEPLPCIQKHFVVILLEKGLFKISLLVTVLYLLWEVLFFIELVVLWTPLPCLSLRKAIYAYALFCTKACPRLY